MAENNNNIEPGKKRKVRKEYQTIRCENDGVFLDKLVNHYLGLGWECLGGVSIAVETIPYDGCKSRRVHACQAMVREVEVEVEG